MPAPKKYPDEVRERAVRMVFEIREQTGQQQGAIARVADRLGINRETLRNWVRQAEVDGGKRPGTSSVDSQRIAELERENRELRRANEILKAAASFFAAELCATRRRVDRGRVRDRPGWVVVAEICALIRIVGWGGVPVPAHGEDRFGRHGGTDRALLAAWVARHRAHRVGA